ncbi:MAG: kelch repeat-containing protein [Cyanobacteriota bacterium]
MKNILLLLVFILPIYSCGLSSAELKATSVVKENIKPNVSYIFSEKKDLDVKLANIKQNFSTTKANNKVYIIGGTNANAILTDNEVFDLNDLSIKSNASIQSSKIDFSSVFFNNSIYVIGGFNVSSRLNEIDSYDIQKDLWEKKSPILTKRRGLGSIVVDNKIYAIGGNISDSEWSDDIEYYETENDLWRRLTSMGTKRSSFSIASINNKIYIIGGENNTGVLDKVEEYNIKTDKWKEKLSLPEPILGGRIVIIDDYILIIGGKDKDKKPLKSTYIFNTTNNTWTKGADLEEAMDSFGLAYDSEKKKIYIFGGARNGVVTDKITSYTISQ